MDPMANFDLGWHYDGVIYIENFIGPETFPSIKTVTYYLLIILI